MGIAHSSSMFPLLFYWPVYLVSVAEDHFQVLKGASEGSFAVLFLGAQFIGYFVMVLLFRCVLRVFRRTHPKPVEQLLERIAQAVEKKD
jgi:hypothetical protein